MHQERWLLRNSSWFNPSAKSNAPAYEFSALSQAGQYNKEISASARKYKLNPDLISRIIYVETTHGYYSDITALIGANKSILPMKINTKFWGNAFGVKADLHNPSINIDQGARMLSYTVKAIGPRATIAQVATLYNNLSADQISNYGARVASVARTRPWIRK